MPIDASDWVRARRTNKSWASFGPRARRDPCLSGSCLSLAREARMLRMATNANPALLLVGGAGAPHNNPLNLTESLASWARAPRPRFRADARKSPLGAAWRRRCMLVANL